jgi:Arc/MetJ-type ribon-helix-helix transcriptional regulator
MSRQVTLRLPDDLVAFMDAQIEHGDAPSRAAVVTRAVQREQRRALALRDAEILTAQENADDLDQLAADSAGTPLDVD